eukprot:TRINITY_DN68981_c0_g1_i1.p1 TRINITY_DN68981_c0_g1~~TRINITY_DN68981_c0_g1_i1.p1  ORF type:complete len:128 (-),score=17.42 TRINITY_DN68981_c0_g1_i1:119-502(-)
MVPQWRRKSLLLMAWQRCRRSLLLITWQWRRKSLFLMAFTIKNMQFPGPLVASAMKDYIGDNKVYVKTVSKLTHHASDKWKLCQQADGTYTIESSGFAGPLIASIIVDSDGDNEVFVRSFVERSKTL